MHFNKYVLSLLKNLGELLILDYSSASEDSIKVPKYNLYEQKNLWENLARVFPLS